MNPRLGNQLTCGLHPRCIDTGKRLGNLILVYPRLGNQLSCAPGVWTLGSSWGT